MAKEYFMQPGFRYMMEDHFAMSAWVNSQCVLAAGFVSIYPHRATAWALVGADAGPYLTQLTRKVRQGIEMQPFKRIEMLVDYEFDAGHRWAKMLGFTVENPRMRYSGTFGNDETLYVRIKE